MRRLWRLGLVLVLLAAGLAGRPGHAQEPAPKPVTIYTGLAEPELAPLGALMAREKIPVRVVSIDDDRLIEQLAEDGPSGPADIVLLSGIDRLDRAVQAGVLQPFALPAVEQAVPPALRDPTAHWFGVAKIARVIVYAADRVKPGDVARYESLAAPAWSDRLCLAPAGRAENRGLLAALVGRLGPDGAEAWAKGVAENATLTEVPMPSGPSTAVDRALVEAIAGGACDVALIGSRTMAWLAEPGKDAAQLRAKVGFVWPDQGHGGTHVDVIGAGIAAGSDRRDAVLHALALLVGDEGQRLIGQAFRAYPTKAEVPLTDALTRYGPFEAASTPLGTLLPLLPQARAIAERVGWP